MFTLRSLEKIESILRTDLEGAEQMLNGALQDQQPEARIRFKQALHRFTVFVLYGAVPKELRCT